LDFYFKIPKKSKISLRAWAVATLRLFILDVRRPINCEISERDYMFFCCTIILNSMLSLALYSAGLGMPYYFIILFLLWNMFYEKKNPILT